MQPASAVSNGGGLGIIASGGETADWLRDQIKKTREMTDKPFGVNIMLLADNVDELMEVVKEEKVPVVTTGAGNPGKYIASLKAGRNKSDTCSRQCGACNQGCESRR